MGKHLADIVVPKHLAAFDGRRAAAMDALAGPACTERRPDGACDCARKVTAGKTSERFGRLVLPHLKEAYTLARRITGDRIDAEDVVQEACVRALRTTATASDAKARDLILAAVRNAAAAWLGKYRPVACVPTEEFGPSEHDQMQAWDTDGESPETALIAKADAAILEAAIGRLPARFREALVMRDIWGLSYREISERAGVPIGTVMSRLARGRDRLIAAIERHAR